MIKCKNKNNYSIPLLVLIIAVCLFLFNENKNKKWNVFKDVNLSALHNCTHGKCSSQWKLQNIKISGITYVTVLF